MGDKHDECSVLLLVRTVHTQFWSYLENGVM